MRVVGDLTWQPVQLSLTLTSFSISYAAASLIVSVVANEYETFPVGSLLCQLLYPAADIITSKSKCPLGENFECKNFNCETLAATYTSVTDVDKLL